MALAKQLTLPNMTQNTVYIDAATVSSSKKNVKRDLKNIIDDIDKIKKAYKALVADKNTRGTYKETANKCVNACTKYRSNLVTVRTSLENKLDSAVQDYVLSMLAELQKAQQAADSINTNAE